MSQNDDNITGEPLFLDGSPLCPRQNLKGNFYDDLYQSYKKSFLDKYLTLDEYIDYKFPSKASDWDGRARAHIRWEELIEKIDFDEYYQNVSKEFEETKRRVKQRRAEQVKSVNRYELGAREFTLTYSDKWEGYTDAHARLLMSTAIQKLCKTYKNEIIQLRAVGEVGKQGHSHIHCFYKLKGGKKITDKNFTRAYPMWNTKIKVGATGHRGGHHATVKEESDFLGYIEKEIQNTWFEVNIENSENPENFFQP